MGADQDGVAAHFANKHELKRKERKKISFREYRIGAATKSQELKAKRKRFNG